jgi:hypothetical protein
MVQPAREIGWLLCLAGVPVYFGLCAFLQPDGYWYLRGLSYSLLWPIVFAFTILPGVLMGVRLRSWQAGVALTEVVTVVVAMLLFAPALGDLFKSPFRGALIMTHLALFPPLLLSVLIGYFARSR